MLLATNHWCKNVQIFAPCLNEWCKKREKKRDGGEKD
jgi:hypothetical protein